MYGDKMKLLDILTEKKSIDDGIRVVASPAIGLLAGRPSATIKSLKARAATDPNGLLSDLGIETGSITTNDNFSDFLNSAFKQMISSATGNKKAKLLQDLFDDPEIVKSATKGKRAVLIKLSSEGLKLAQKDARKFLRTYAFWFSSTTEALESTVPQLGLNLTTYVKFQYVQAEKAIIVYKSNRSWASL